MVKNQDKNIYQPSLLEEALRNWEQQFNSLIDVEGLPEIYKYGFLPETNGNISC